MQSKAEIHDGTSLLLSVIGLWGAAVAILAAQGVFKSLYPPLIAPIVFMGIAAPTAAYAVSASVQRNFSSLGLKWITAFHVWRIPAAMLFFWYGAHGLLPDLFVRNAAWGDLIAGILAAAVTLSRKARGRYLGFHLFGFADFVLAVGTGLYLTVIQDPLMGPVADLPVALIPLWGVGISGASHLIAFDLLRRNRGL